RREDMQTLGEFKLPHFFNYPPYFTLQPVRDTREKQIQLWKELILDYCRTQKIFVVGLDEDFPLFSNPVIERSLSHEAREAFLSALVAEGRAEWLDKSHKKILILWHSIKDWADLIISFVDIRVAPGTHATEAAVNKQLNDKERVAAALENPNLVDMVDECLAPSYG
ncbi:UNVERIFIED_CONTAM: Vacuolar protein sorting-associated protein 25, partial [Sesamum indicum]